MRVFICHISRVLAAFVVLGLSVALARPSVAIRAAVVGNDTPIVRQISAAAPSAPESTAPEIFGLPQGFVIGVFVVTVLVLGFMAIMLVVRARRRRRW